MPNILDPKFKYTPAAQTDLRASFRKWQRDYARDWDAAHIENEARNLAEAREVVRPIARRRGRG